MKFALNCLAVAGLVVVAASHQAAAGPATNLVTNGSFETFANGVFTGWTNSGNPGINPNQFAVQQPTDGTTAGQYGDVVTPDPFSFSSTASGTHAAYFVADQADIKMSQTISLTVGQTYAIGFDLYENRSGAGNPGPFNLAGSIDNGSGLLPVATASSSSLSPGVWTHFASTFVATTANPLFTFEFKSGTTPAVDVLVDDVYVTVAEPASLAVFGFGLISLWGMRRARTRNVPVR